MADREERGLDDLLGLMRDPSNKMRDRLNSAVSAARISPLSMGEEPAPEAIVFLRWIIDYKRDGSQFSAAFRRESAAAIGWWERKCKRAELTYAAPDSAETQASWRKLVNGGLRAHLAKRGRWPARQDVLLTEADEIEVADLPDPERVLSAILLPTGNRKARRRAKSIDERVAEPWTGTAEERKALVRPLAHLVHQRLKAFGLAA